MARTKGGVVSRRRRNRVLKQAKGFFGSKHCLYKVANQQVMKSLMYAYRDRKNNKRNFRKLWIVRINAASRMNGLSYNQLMHGLKLANVDINRKMLSELAINDFAAFAKLVEKAKKERSAYLRCTNSQKQKNKRFANKKTGKANPMQDKVGNDWGFR